MCCWVSLWAPNMIKRNKRRQLSEGIRKKGIVKQGPDKPTTGKPRWTIFK